MFSLNDLKGLLIHDVLFGEVWNEEAIMKYHLINAKNNGVTKEEIAAIITHATMYCGWPKGWAVFRLAKEVWP